MLELLFLLLPIAAAYGWYMGHRSAKKDQDDISNKLSRDYVAGVNFLLSNQTDKAVDLFLDMLQKQEVENEIESNSQFEAELTLGNLFRSRGEVDRALRIHQALDRSPHYSFEQKLLAKQQLAKDFMTIGFYDRAENLYIMLVDEPDFAENALQQLLVIYQKTKEWKNAVNIAEKLNKLSPKENNIELAQCYCEYAISSEVESLSEKRTILLKALNVSPTCVRASVLLADLNIETEQYIDAIKTLENVLCQNSVYIGEVLKKLKYCYEKINELDSFELFLIRAGQQTQDNNVNLMLAKLVKDKDGLNAAQTVLYQQLAKNPTTLVFHQFIQYQIDDAEDGRGKESLILLHKMVGERIKQGFTYRCTNCGYQTHKLVWNCPSCKQWETIRPENN
ncbi:lipopolysaccharide assembly protein LapB [Haemophilus pittmaniae]|uniref:lipopolysaccharide assembly protein LapB n=1 Tax=Haemophilus pittmaniae TaxID=249188 RepID=UPI000B94A3E2|nr:lipopolysaccharide assembly protein LapB [Haemophilus pittmaniae]SNV81521.1 tetratricopeptide repeat protein [Haemophilus pittmaniae]